MSLRERVARNMNGVKAALIGLAVAAAGIGGFYAVTSSQSREIRENRRFAVIACEESNRVRAAEITLWEFVINLSGSAPRPDETAAQKARRAQQLAEFRAFLQRTFAPLDCQAVNRDGEGPKPAPTASDSPTPPAVVSPFPVPTVTATATATVRVPVPGPTETVTACRQRNGRPCPPRR